MRMIRLFGKAIGRILLLPVLLILLICQGAVHMMVNVYSIFKWGIGILCAIALIGTIIWFRQDYMRYVLVAIVEAALIAVLVAGVFIEALLGLAVKTITEIIIA